MVKALKVTTALNLSNISLILISRTTFFQGTDFPWQIITFMGKPGLGLGNQLLLGLGEICNEGEVNIRENCKKSLIHCFKKVDKTFIILPISFQYKLYILLKVNRQLSYNMLKLLKTEGYYVVGR